MPTKATITEHGNADRLLAQMPIEVREKHLKKAMRRGGNEVAKEARRLVPRPGYPGDDPTKIPLARTIRTVVRVYRDHVVAVVGPKWPEGAHGHLVEFGHAIQRNTPGPTRTRPRPFMRPASDGTLPQQNAAVVRSLRGDVPELAR